MALEINDGNFEKLIGTEGVAVIDFWAVWCGPCKAVAPIIEQMASEFDGQAVIGKVNVDMNPQLSEKYGIRSIPTVLYFKDGEVVDKVVGATSKSKYISKLETQLA